MTLLQDLAKLTDPKVPDAEKKEAEKNIQARHTIVMGQHKAADYVHPHLNTDSIE